MYGAQKVTIDFFFFSIFFISCILHLTFMSRHDFLVPVDGMSLAFVLDHNFNVFYGLYKAQIKTNLIPFCCKKKVRNYTENRMSTQGEFLWQEVSF